MSGPLLLSFTSQTIHLSTRSQFQKLIKENSLQYQINVLALNLLIHNTKLFNKKPNFNLKQK